MADRGIGAALRFVESERLRLIAATRDLVASDLRGRGALGEVLQVRVPECWPPELYDRTAMDLALRDLERAEANGWSFWYLVLKGADEEPLVGICGFKGRPDAKGSVEISYSILKPYRNLGFATEAVFRLVDWAFTHAGVREVCAETLPFLKQSIRVLEKNGFKFTGGGSEHGVVRYALQRTRRD